MSNAMTPKTEKCPSCGSVEQFTSLRPYCPNPFHWRKPAPTPPLPEQEGAAALEKEWLAQSEISSYQNWLHAKYFGLQDELKRMREALEVAVMACEAGKVRYSRNHGQPNPSPAFPTHVTFSLDSYATLQKALGTALAASQKGRGSV